MNKTKIPWADWTWNPLVGCSPVSEGCDHCYAARISARFGLPWGKAVMMPERLGEPSSVKKPGRVFVCSMSDLGRDDVTDAMRLDVYAAMQDAPQHTYLLLTKRPGPWLSDVPENVWVGITAEGQRWYDERWSLLMQYADHVGVRFVSVEPMLGPVKLASCFPLPDWVICGPETGPGARPCMIGWVMDLRDETHKADIPFFDKRKPPLYSQAFPVAAGEAVRR